MVQGPLSAAVNVTMMATYFSFRGPDLRSVPTWIQQAGTNIGWRNMADLGLLFFAWLSGHPIAACCQAREKP
jgi:hypothetical protein